MEELFEAAEDEGGEVFEIEDGRAVEEGGGGGGGQRESATSCERKFAALRMESGVVLRLLWLLEGLLPSFFAPPWCDARPRRAVAVSLTVRRWCIGNTLEKLGVGPRSDKGSG